MKPTEEDLRRDLAADLKLCEAATPGPWVDFPGDDGPFVGRVYSVAGDGFVWVADTPELDERDDDMAFIAAARDACPAAIRRALAAEEILNAPLVALFGDGRKPTENERHLLNLLSWREKEAGGLKAECARLQGVIELLSAREGKQP